jgi:thioredoxin 2
MAKPIDVNADSFDQEVLQHDQPVLVDFWSPSCPHCLQLNPHYDTVAEQGSDLAKFCKVSVADAMPLFHKWGVSAVPTLILFKGGQEVTRQSGARGADELLQWLKENL